VELKIDNASIETLVKEQIKVAVAEALSRQSPALVNRLVDIALETKRNHYDRTSILDESINQMIRQEAQEGVKEWLDTKRADIRKQVFAALSKKSDGLVAKVVEQLVISLGNNLHVKAWLGND
jgi:hypothetical protein